MSTFTANRVSPWQMIGTSTRGAASAQEALEHAGLANWQIRKVHQTGSELSDSGVQVIDNPDAVMLVRNDPLRGGKTRYLSTVGPRYGIRQNEEQAELIDALVAESGSEGVAEAGSLRDGKRTFITMELPAQMKVGGFDVVKRRLAVYNSHDRTSALRVRMDLLRQVCANGLTATIPGHSAQVSIKHTSRSKLNVAAIRGKLGALYDYADSFEAEAERMINETMRTGEFFDLVDKVWPVKDDASKQARNNADTRRGKLEFLWSDAPTQRGITGTKWAAYQAITEYVDHYSRAKTDTVRALRVVSGAASVVNPKNHAWRLLATS